MKLDRIMWGIVLLFIGSVLLLENFDIIDFHWGNIWRFWPIFLIIGGVNILFSKNKSQLGGIISIAVLVVTLIVLFFKGQERRDVHTTIREEIRDEFRGEFDSDRKNPKNLHFSAPLPDSLSKQTVLNINGGGTSFNLIGPTDSLITAHVEKRSGDFTLETVTSNDLTTVNFNMKGKGKWDMGDGGNDVNFKMNNNPDWDIYMKMGAGEVNFDLADYKVSSFNFEGGAAALNVKLGSLLPNAAVNVKTGVADVKISVPKEVGCRINTKTGLSSKDFDDFGKKNDGSFETSNFNNTNKKIIITLDGGLSSFEVKRY